MKEIGHTLLHSQTTSLFGSNDVLKKKKWPVFVFPPLTFSRAMFPAKKYGAPQWLWIWLCPMFLAGFGFFLQNFQLHVGTYLYVHQMTQFDLKAEYQNSHSKEDIHMSFGINSTDVAFGSLEDPVTGSMDYQVVPIHSLDKFALLFPFLYALMAVGTDDRYSWTKVMIAFFFLAFFKGLFSWLTVIPDSNGWQVCNDRLQPAGKYDIHWYAQKHTVWDLFLMYVENPTSRLCADMMYSGHTYFVTLFAFGLFEVTRHAFFRMLPWKRSMFESVITIAAIIQQSAEVYFVLKSRFHYTSDVAMAFLMTYLMFTNSSIAAIAGWWTHPPESTWVQSLSDKLDDSTWSQNRWLSALRPSGLVSLGCCCPSRFSQQWIYSQADLKRLIKVIKDSRENASHGEDPEEKDKKQEAQNDAKNKGTQFQMNDDIEKWHLDIILKMVKHDDDGKENPYPKDGNRGTNEEPLLP